MRSTLPNQLSFRLRSLIEAADLERDPLLIANGARLLAEVQQWEEKGERLLQRLAAFERTATSSGDSAPGSHADWAYQVLLDNDGPMPYREIADSIKARGFKHAREPKNPDKQLGDSVWTAMYEDARFTKVGRGVFDLTERL
jgi:PHD/YefM family antitoxin component YafN of YafNO toxin-antitoxin module